MRGRPPGQHSKINTYSPNSISSSLHRNHSNPHAPPPQIPRRSHKNLSMHEILTLQLGHRANHLATHFWNTQESYFSAFPTSATSPSNEAPAPSATPPPSSLVDHDIHWREGISAVGGEDTYTPRTLIYDLKGGFGGLRGWGAAGDVGADDGRNGAW